MTRSAGTASATTYVVVKRYVSLSGVASEWVMSRHRKLANALTRSHAADIALARLFGGQRLPLTWTVIDMRDYSECRLGIATQWGEQNEKDEQGRACARRPVGTGQSATTAGRKRGGNPRGVRATPTPEGC